MDKQQPILAKIKHRSKHKPHTSLGQKVFILISATIITLISILYANFLDDKHSGQAAGSLTVSINQSADTADPNPSYVSLFTIRFNEPINSSSFSSDDITLGGTAPGQTIQSITEIDNFNQTAYELRVTANGAGTIIPTIAQNLITAANVGSGLNQASTSSDNSVSYDV